MQNMSIMYNDSMFSIFGLKIDEVKIFGINISFNKTYVSPGDKEPVEPALDKEEKKLCRELENLYRTNGIEGLSPTKMFMSCKSLMQDGRTKDIYSIAQMACSLREILYPFWSNSSKKMSGDTERKGSAIRNTGSAHSKEVINKKIGEIYGTLTRMAHHQYDFKDKDKCFGEFLDKFGEFKSSLRYVFENQIHINNKIDKIV